MMDAKDEVITCGTSPLIRTTYITSQGRVKLSLANSVCAHHLPYGRCVLLDRFGVADRSFHGRLHQVLFGICRVEMKRASSVDNNLEWRV